MRRMPSVSESEIVCSGAIRSAALIEGIKDVAKSNEQPNPEYQEGSDVTIAASALSVANLKGDG